MIRIGYAPGAFDLFHIGHLNLLRRAKDNCDYLVAGVVADEVLIEHKGVTPVIPLAERVESVRRCSRSGDGDDKVAAEHNQARRNCRPPASEGFCVTRRRGWR